MRYLLLILIFSFSINVHAQPSKSVYKNILHPNIINNEDILNLAVSIIEEEAKLNPELVYFRIHLLNEIYGNENFDIETNGQNELNVARRYYISLRNRWLDKQIEFINNNYQNTLGIERVIKFFEGFRLKQKEIVNELGFSIDSNKVNFYAAFFISKGIITKYDKSVKYSNLRYEYENEIIKKINSQSSFRNDITDMFSDNIYNEIENNLNILVGKDDIDFGKLLLIKDFREYSINNINLLGIGVKYSSNLNRQYRSIDINNDYKNLPYNLGEISSVRNISFELSFKFLLKDIMNYFSYLDGSIFYSNYRSRYNINSEDYNTTISINGNRFNGEEQFNTIEFRNIKFLDGKNFDIGIKLMTPVWVISKNTICEFGGIFYYQSNSFTVEYNYDFINYISYYNVLGNYIYRDIIQNFTNVYESKKTTNKKLNFSPIISLKYINMLNHFDLVLTTDIHNYSLGIRATY